MKKEIKIKKKGKKGIVRYSEGTPVAFEIDFPIFSEKSWLEHYFETERQFIIPQSIEIDDFEIKTAKPIENIGFFEQSFGEMHKQTGFEYEF